MIAIKDMEIPKNCVECNHMDLQQAINCQLIYSGCANCGRHPNCPLVDIENNYKELRSIALRVKHKTGSIDTLIDTLDDLLRGSENE